MPREERALALEELDYVLRVNQHNGRRCAPVFFAGLKPCASTGASMFQLDYR